jgi:hypothetical protein
MTSSSMPCLTSGSDSTNARAESSESASSNEHAPRTSPRYQICLTCPSEYNVRARSASSSRIGANSESLKTSVRIREIARNCMDFRTFRAALMNSRRPVFDHRTGSANKHCRYNYRLNHYLKRGQIVARKTTIGNPGSKIYVALQATKIRHSVHCLFRQITA